MNNPADTLAALAPCPFCGRTDSVRIRKTKDGQRVVVCDASTKNRLYGCGGSCGYKASKAEAISAWNRRASLKGEAEPRKPDGYAYRYPHHDGDTVIRFTCGQEINGARPIEAVPYFYGTPPAPQAVGEAINWSLVREGLDYFDRAGDAGDKLYVAEIRKALSTPSPAPQADKDLMQRTVDKVVSKVMGQREEILQAFVAKYGFQPDEAVQVVGADGSWRVMRRQDMSTPSPAPQGGGALALPPDGHYIIRYADHDEDDEEFSGDNAREFALRRFEQRSAAWTCRLFAMVDCSGFGPEPQPVARVATPPAQQPGEVGSCEWHQQDEGGDHISTGCGNEFVLNDASDYEDGKPAFPFCPYCAKPTVFNHWHDEDEEADAALAPKEK